MLEDVDLNSDWKPPFVFLETSMGNITVELYWEHAPKLQGGDPTGTGRGGTSVYGAPFEDEIDDRLKHTGAGIISMANSGPDSNCSQFFFTLAPAQWLDGKHTIFGRIYEGIKVLEKLVWSLRMEMIDLCSLSKFLKHPQNKGKKDMQLPFLTGFDHMKVNSMVK
ncbi:Peptidyl-prolyl cis-trans isomerase-like [Trichinella spiralis]|uniref:Peptidyl-prolyl cis-trans isomerase n=1 Tax=Trichinella spiralis TaxID=6334 RepID=A0ABR3L0F6_TRISP